MNKSVTIILSIGLSTISTILTYAYIAILYAEKTRFYWLIAPAIISIVITLAAIVLLAKKQNDFLHYAKLFICLVIGIAIAAVAFYLFQRFFYHIGLGGRKNKLLFFIFGGGLITFLELLDLFVMYMIGGKKAKEGPTNE